MKQLYIIDSLNVLHSDIEAKQLLNQSGLEVALQWLVNCCASLYVPKEREVYLVVDSSQSKLVHVPIFKEDCFAIVHAPVHLTADGLIEQWVRKIGQSERIAVVTNDRMIQDSVSASGAEVMTPLSFLRLCKQAAKAMGDSIDHQRKSRSKPFNNPFDLLS